ncbi:MAG: hypothetical protein WCL08_01205 [Verrucomicrobiota bacterium]
MFKTLRMRSPHIAFFVFVSLQCLKSVQIFAAESSPATVREEAWQECREICHWKVHLSRKLPPGDAPEMAETLELLRKHLEEIVRVVPANAVAELQKVPLWISPEYPKTQPKAEYHPGAGWLRDHGRDPVMAKGVELTNTRRFQQETDRMPYFILHELAHAYHDRVLEGGMRNVEIVAAYERAKASGRYEKVERVNGGNRPHTFELAYAMTNPREYFAETSEAYFGQNDFYPFNRMELMQHDPEMADLLRKLWGVESSVSQ